MLADGSLQLPLSIESSVEREHLMGLIVHSCDLGMYLLHLGVWQYLLFYLRSISLLPECDTNTLTSNCCVQGMV